MARSMGAGFAVSGGYSDPRYALDPSLVRKLDKYAIPGKDNQPSSIVRVRMVPRPDPAVVLDEIPIQTARGLPRYMLPRIVRHAAGAKK